MIEITVDVLLEGSELEIDVQLESSELDVDVELSSTSIGSGGIGNVNMITANATLITE